MWFKNLQVFRVSGTTEKLEDDLSISPLQPCGSIYRRVLHPEASPIG